MTEFLFFHSEGVGKKAHDTGEENTVRHSREGSTEQT